MADDDGVVAGALGELPAVSLGSLNVAHNGSLGDRRQRKNVSHREGSLLAAVNEHASVHALRGHNELVVLAVLVHVHELHLGEGSSAPGVVDDVLHYSADVSVLLSVINGAHLGGSLARAGVGPEDPSLALTASGYDLTHLAEAREAREKRKRKRGGFCEKGRECQEKTAGAAGGKMGQSER